MSVSINRFRKRVEIIITNGLNGAWRVGDVLVPGVYSCVIHNHLFSFPTFFESK